MYDYRDFLTKSRILAQCATALSIATRHLCQMSLIGSVVPPNINSRTSLPCPENLKSDQDSTSYIVDRLVGHFAYCATPLSLMSFKLSKTFNYQPLFFHSPTQNENVKKVQSVFLPNWNWLFLLIFSLFKVEKIKIHDWSTAEVSSWISQLCSSN